MSFNPKPEEQRDKQRSFDLEDDMELEQTVIHDNLQVLEEESKIVLAPDLNDSMDLNNSRVSSTPKVSLQELLNPVRSGSGSNKSLSRMSRIQGEFSQPVQT